MKKSETIFFWALSKEIGNKRYILDFKKFECFGSLFLSMIVTSVLFITYMYTDITRMTGIITTLTSGLLFAFLGLLGFIIAGLSILMASLDGEFLKIAKNSNRVDAIKRILFSFYYLGYVIAWIIVLSAFIFIFASSDLPMYLPSLIIISFIYSYMVLFSLFFCVTLLGTCFHMFFIKNSMINDSKKTVTDELNFLHLKIDGLLKLMNDRECIQSEEYLRVLNELVESEYNGNEEIKNRLKEYF